MMVARNVSRIFFVWVVIPVFIVTIGVLLFIQPVLNENLSGQQIHAENKSGIILSTTMGPVHNANPWTMHLIDPKPASGSDGVKLADVNGDGFPDLVTGFEESGISRIYIHPGPRHVRSHWKYVELRSPDVEDAVLVDLDNNGIMDLVTASEGSTDQIIFHWAPENSDNYLDPSHWKSEVVPLVNELSAWMFVVPMDIDGQNGMDLLIGSKRKRDERDDDRAVVGWLKCPVNPKEISKWKFFPLTKAGWIMSVVPVDMDGDGNPDILISDRKFSTQTGVRWLENPGRDDVGFYKEWTSHMIGVEDGEPMFLEMADLNGDGLDEIIVPDLYNGLKIFEQTNNTNRRWNLHTVSYPDWSGTRGKAVAAGDLDRDGKPEIVLSFEEEGNVASLPYEKYKENGRHSVIRASYQTDPFSGKWTFHKVSNLRGRKFDLVNLIDLDGDGDLDVLTNDENEEGDGLGVVWYENPGV